jgi:hypothetical protein
MLDSGGSAAEPAATDKRRLRENFMIGPRTNAGSDRNSLLLRMINHATFTVGSRRVS